MTTDDPFEAAVSAAINADIARMRDLPRGAKPLVWPSPSRDQVAALIRPWFDRAMAAEATLAEVRQTIATFRAHHGHSVLLAEGITQILDREPLP